MPGTDVRFDSIAPFLVVEDVVASAEYYRDKFGFQFERYWGDPPSFVILERDNVHLMLRSGAGRPSPNQGADGLWDAYIWLRSGVEQLYAQCQERGIEIHQALHATFYDVHEFEIRDLNGYVIAFGEPARQVRLHEISPIGNSDPGRMPVVDVARAITYYENRLGFTPMNQNLPHSVTVVRDDVSIRLVQKDLVGLDPEQESCYIGVENVDVLLKEYQEKGAVDPTTSLELMEHEGKTYRVFWLRDPDGLCYCIGERQA